MASTGLSNSKISVPVGLPLGFQVTTVGSPSIGYLSSEPVSHPPWATNLPTSFKSRAQNVLQSITLRGLFHTRAPCWLASTLLSTKVAQKSPMACLAQPHCLNTSTLAILVSKYAHSALDPLSMHLSGLLGCLCPFLPISFSESAKLTLCFVQIPGLWYVACIRNMSKYNHTVAYEMLKHVYIIEHSQPPTSLGAMFRIFRMPRAMLCPLCGHQTENKYAQRQDGRTCVWARV